MALQLRRGTNAERLQFTPLAGELIYTTDTKEVFIGDGSTVGGKPVTAFNSEDAQDFVAPMFTNGLHTGISFTYDELTNTINALVTDEEKTLNSLFDVTITQPLVAGQVLKYSGSTWYNADESIYSVIEDATPSLGGNLDLNGNDILGTGNIDTTGTINVSDSATFRNVNIFSTSEKIGTGLGVFSITNGNPSFPGWIDSIISKGTWDAPINPEAGEFLGGYKISAYINNSSKPVTMLASELAATADLQSAIPAANFYIAVTANTDVVRFTFRPNGVFEAPVIKATNYETTNLPTNPEKGYIVFDSTANQFKGWNGTAWVVLG